MKKRQLNSMLDLNWIRKNSHVLKDMFKARNLRESEVDALLLCDRDYRELLKDLEQIKKEKNILDHDISLFCSKYEKDEWQKVEGSKEYLEKANELKKKEGEIKPKFDEARIRLKEKLSFLPNILDSIVPYGKGEEENKEEHRWGTPTEQLRNHMDIGYSLGGLDFEQASLVAGSRFVYLKGILARLERALGQWMLDVHTREYGFQEMTTPYLVKKEAMFGAGQLPKFQADLFETTDGRFLIPTGEVSLVNWAAEKVFSPQELPLCLTALTPCFRSEAGSAGKDTHGMMRHHQFNKVELVVICHPQEEQQWHEKITRQAEVLLERLELPYRRMLLCSGDTGRGSCKTYDLEVWIPSEKRYREIASCSFCGTYQARRLTIKIKGEGFAHTLNGSGLPTGRTLLALLENHQQSDGTVLIPKVLWPYMGGLTCLKKE